MHDLTPQTALGGAAPRTEKIGAVCLTEVPDLALASVAARSGQADAVRAKLEDLLHHPAPGPNSAVLAEPYAAVWMGPDQWMLGAPLESHEDIADRLSDEFGDAASITEQSDGWVTIDLEGPSVVDILERLCPAPSRGMQAGAAMATTIHQMRCFVICGAPGRFFRLLGPRSSAGSLWHALTQAAHSVR